MLRYERAFLLPPEWGNSRKPNAVDYWERLGYRVVPATGGFIATRGSLRGNIFSFDMSRVLAVVRVEFDSAGVARVETEIEQRFQKFTAANDMFFRFELVDFQSVVQSGKSLINLWPPTSRSSSPRMRRAFKSGVVGRRSRALLADRLSRLEAVVSFADFSPESLGVVDEPVSVAARITVSPRASVEDAVLHDGSKSRASWPLWIVYGFFFMWWAVDLVQSAGAMVSMFPRGAVGIVMLIVEAAALGVGLAIVLSFAESRLLMPRVTWLSMGAVPGLLWMWFGFGVADGFYGGANDAAMATLALAIAWILVRRKGQADPSTRGHDLPNPDAETDGGDGINMNGEARRSCRNTLGGGIDCTGRSAVAEDTFDHPIAAVVLLSVSIVNCTLLGALALGGLWLIAEARNSSDFGFVVGYLGVSALLSAVILVPFASTMLTSGAKAINGELLRSDARSTGRLLMWGGLLALLPICVIWFTWPLAVVPLAFAASYGGVGLMLSHLAGPTIVTPANPVPKGASDTHIAITLESFRDISEEETDTIPRIEGRARVEIANQVPDCETRLSQDFDWD